MTNETNFGGYPSTVYEPKVNADIRGESLLLNKRHKPEIAMADVAIKHLFEDGHALSTEDFKAIYEENGANPNTARVNLVSEIRNRRFPTRIGMAIREVKYPKTPFFLKAELTLENTDLPERITAFQRSV